jgi:hypothetical protein
LILPLVVVRLRCIEKGCVFDLDLDDDVGCLVQSSTRGEGNWYNPLINLYQRMESSIGPRGSLCDIVFSFVPSHVKLSSPHVSFLQNSSAHPLHNGPTSLC